MTSLDLSGIGIVDNHCHPYRVSDILEFESRDFATRSTHVGTMLVFEGQLKNERIDTTVWNNAAILGETTLLPRCATRWLAEYLGCAATQVMEVRDAALRADPSGYARALMRAEGIEAVLEAGGPQNPATRDEFETALGTPVFSVARIESWIDQFKDGSFDEFVDLVTGAAKAAVNDPDCVAFKSLIAYRSGLDVGDPSAASARESFQNWKRCGWQDDRRVSKDIYDFILRKIVIVALETERPLHIHCSATRFSLENSHPYKLWGLIESAPDQQFVLIHGGQPWILEAASMASRLPNVALDISSIAPWGLSLVDWTLEMLLGSVSWTQVLYGSDAPGYDPEALWLSARVGRRAVSQALVRLVGRDQATLSEATDIARAVLGDNCRRIHGLPAFGRTR